MPEWTGANRKIEKVGLIGIGTMGKCMMSSLLKAGWKMVAYDKFEKAADYARQAGCEIAQSPKELALQCKVILTSLPGPVQIEEVMFGADGMYDSLGSNHVVIDTSTVDPNTSRMVSEKLSEKGAAYLDCPILGRPSAVGKWMLPTGGRPEVLEYVRPVLSAFAANAVCVGGSGSGNALKLLNQMMFSTINAISSEVLAIADKVGIDKKVFLDTVAGSGAATVSGLFKEVGKNIVADDYDHPTFTVDLLIKDTKLALQMAKDAKAPSVIAGTVQMYNEIASANGLGRKDTSALYKVYSRHYREEK